MKCEDHFITSARLREFDCDHDTGDCITIDLACGDGGTQIFDFPANGTYEGYEHIPEVGAYDKSEFRLLEVEQSQCGEGYAYTECAGYNTESYVRCESGANIIGARFRYFDCDSEYPDRDCVALDVICE